MLAVCDDCGNWTAVDATEERHDGGPVGRCERCRRETTEPLAAVRSLVPI